MVTANVTLKSVKLSQADVVVGLVKMEPRSFRGRSSNSRIRTSPTVRGTRDVLPRVGTFAVSYTDPCVLQAMMFAAQLAGRGAWRLRCQLPAVTTRITQRGESLVEETTTTLIKSVAIGRARAPSATSSS